MLLLSVWGSYHRDRDPGPCSQLCKKWHALTVLALAAGIVIVLNG